MTNKKKERPVPVKSVKKALDILTLLLLNDSSGRGWRLTEIAETFGMPVNTVHNLLRTMSVCGYAEQNADGRYTGGPLARNIAYGNMQNPRDFPAILRRAVRSAALELSETVTFIALERNVWTTFLTVGPSGTVAGNNREFVRKYYLYEAATGRVIYTFSTPGQKRLLRRENGDPADTWPDYRTDMEKIRRDGFCSVFRGRYGVYSCAAPVFRPDGSLLGAIGTPLVRESEPSRAEKLRIFGILRDAAEKIRKALEHSRGLESQS